MPGSPRPSRDGPWKGHPPLESPKIAYFSMEIALSDAIPTYSGGLGVLAGDTIRAAADGGVRLIGVTLAHRKGYFRQRLDTSGVQTEESIEWTPERVASPLPVRVSVTIAGRAVTIRPWSYEVRGAMGDSVPVLLLDTDVPENCAEDRRITDHLYGGDDAYRLAQEAVLGIGGVRVLRALGHDQLRRFHMNEGHAALLVLELAREEMERRHEEAITREVAHTVRPLCVFTTHTPVPAGHDQFPIETVHRVLGDFHGAFAEEALDFCLDGVLNMTYLALENSHYVNGVAKRHGEVSQQMFAQYRVDSITNGVHAGYWTAAPLQRLFDQHISAWRSDNASFRYALGIPRHDLWAAHQRVKEGLIRTVNERSGAGMFAHTFTIGFARRAATYKRADLLFHDAQRLIALNRAAGPIQVIFGGKAHPRDGGGKEMIRRVVRYADELRHQIKVTYLEDYDIALARELVAGVDLWLNTPQPPLEASGTSGMKAALNGVPSLSILDGWWVEGCIEGVTGWAIGDGNGAMFEDDRDADAQSLYNKLETVILPLYYGDQDRFIDVMKHAIALNGAFFNTERMVDQYVRKAYF